MSLRSLESTADAKRTVRRKSVLEIQVLRALCYDDEGRTVRLWFIWLIVLLTRGFMINFMVIHRSPV